MRMNWLAAGMAALMLGGCADAVPTPEAQAKVAAAQPNSQAGDMIKPTISRPIIGPDGNSFQCSAYPGGGAGGVCVQK